MTAPDGGRLPATNSGQETCGAPAGPGVCVLPADHAGRCWPGSHPAPQQPPAQARHTGRATDRQEVGLPGHCNRCAEVVHVRAHPELGCADVGCDDAHDEQPPAQERKRRCGCGATGPCSCLYDWAPAPTVQSCACGGPCEHDGSLAVALAEQQRLHELDPKVFPAPPSEADSASEELEQHVADALRKELVDLLPPGSYAWRHFARVALAASSGVRGEDDQPLRQPGDCHCPQSGTKDDQARERLADVLALHVPVPSLNPKYRHCAECRVDWPCQTAAIAGANQ